MENEAPEGRELNKAEAGAMAPALLQYKVNAMRLSKTTLLRLLLVLLVLALIAVGGYILWQEHQYGVSEEYYDSLRNTGLVKGAWKA